MSGETLIFIILRDAKNAHIQGSAEGWQFTKHFILQKKLVK